MLTGGGAIVIGMFTHAMFANSWPTSAAPAESFAGSISALPKFVVSSTFKAAPWGADAIDTVRGLLVLR